MEKKFLVFGFYFKGFGNICCTFLIYCFWRLFPLLLPQERNWVFSNLRQVKKWKRFDRPKAFFPASAAHVPKFRLFRPFSIRVCEHDKSSKRKERPSRGKKVLLGSFKEKTLVSPLRGMNDHTCIPHCGGILQHPLAHCIIHYKPLIQSSLILI